MAVVFVTRESYAFIDFVLKLVCGHVRLGPAIGGDDAFVGLSAVGDDGVNAIEGLSGATADHERCVSRADVESCWAGFWRRAATRPPAAPPRSFRAWAMRYAKGSGAPRVRAT